MSTGQIYGAMATRTVTIDSNLASKEYHAVNLDTTDDNNVNLATDASAFPYVLASGANGATTEAVGLIVLSGGAKVKLAGTVAPGDKLTATTAGEWIKTTTDTDHYGAVAMQVGVDGDTIEVHVERGMIAG